MSTELKHIIKIYDSEYGYRLFAGTSDNLSVQPLGIVSEIVPRNYHQVEDLLHDFLRRKLQFWSMAFCQLEPNIPAYVGYGSFIHFSRGDKTEYTYFFHAIEARRQEDIPRFVNGIITLLNNRSNMDISEKATEVALGRISTDSFLKELILKLEASINYKQEMEVSLNPKYKDIGVIIHDCAAAPAIAWQMMAYLLSDVKPSWAVYDAVRGNTLQTVLEYENRGNRSYKASELLSQGLRSFVSAPVISRPSPVQEVAPPILIPSNNGKFFPRFDAMQNAPVECDLESQESGNTVINEPKKIQSLLKRCILPLLIITLILSAISPLLWKLSLDSPKSIPMPAKDIVRNALTKDGWTITQLTWGVKGLHIDLDAEQLLAAEKDGRKIAVIKSFVSTSEMDNLEKAIGQYVIYRSVMTRSEPDRTLYLAIHKEVFRDIFEEPLGKLLLEDYQVRLIVYDSQAEVILKWIH